MPQRLPPLNAPPIDNHELRRRLACAETRADGSRCGGGPILVPLRIALAPSAAHPSALAG